MQVDPKTFRHVLGHYPTGVCVITALQGDGRPIGMAVGSFTSVSLEPPLVGFLADARSTTWPEIERAGTFCVNVLAHDQESICRAFSARNVDRFVDVSTHGSPAGLPILAGVAAWIECDLDAVHPVGDHFFVTGAVRALKAEHPLSPLLFVRGGYGRVTSLTNQAGIVRPNAPAGKAGVIG